MRIYSERVERVAAEHMIKLIEIAKEALECEIKVEVYSDEFAFCVNEQDGEDYFIALDLYAINESHPWRVLCATAHEMGHCYDYLHHYKKDVRAWIEADDLYPLITEEQAWRHAVMYLKETGFTEWMFFYKEAIQSFDSYLDAYPYYAKRKRKKFLRDMAKLIGFSEEQLELLSV